MAPQTPSRRVRLPGLGFLLLAFPVLVFLACQLTQDGKGRNTLSFTALYDSLSRYDSVTIVVKDVGSGISDTLFKGKVDAVSEVQNLDAPNYSGKSAVITIRGFNGGKLVSQVDRTFDGERDSTVAVEVRVIPPDTVLPDIPASKLSYAANPAVYWQGEAIATNPATVTGKVDSFTVDPALPAGLAFSKTTGAITGTPSAVAAAAKYVVTAHNPAGSVSVDLTVTVNGPPTGFYYSMNPAEYYQGVAIATNTATIAGTVDSFAVAPPLPAGLTLNKATGAITGTPTIVSGSTAYIVTARNAAGSPKVTLTLTVKPRISGLSYPVNPAVYWKGVALTIPNTPSITGVPDSFTVSPALPAGLVFSKSSGAISGTPTAAAAQAVYTVIARAGADSILVNLTLTVRPPPAINYAVQTASYAKGTAITPNTVNATPAGAVDSFQIAPPLPAGLSIHLLTGAISGTPTAAAPAADYVVTAYNRAGPGKDTLNIAVVDPDTVDLVLDVQKETGLDTGHAQGLNTGYSATTFFGKPGQPFIGLYKFELSGLKAAGFKSAKVRFKTYGYGPIWSGGGQTLTFKIYRVQSDWKEGTGNWYYSNGVYRNNGYTILLNYPMSEAILKGSTNYYDSSGLRYTEHYIVRSQNLTLAQTQDIAVSYPPASIFPSFNDPIPAPANLVDLEIDMTDYVKSVLNGSVTDYGFTVMVEGLGADGTNWIGSMNKEAGDCTHGAKLYLQY